MHAFAFNGFISTSSSPVQKESIRMCVISGFQPSTHTVQCIDRPLEPSRVRQTNQPQIARLASIFTP